MKLKKYLIYPFICLFLAGCYYWPCVWSDSPQTFTFTLDKYEKKIGDKITVDTGDVRVFDEDFELYYEIYKKKETLDGNDKVFIYLFEMVEKISSTCAVFNVPEISEDLISSVNLKIETDFVQKEECSCDDGTWFKRGKSDKELTIVK